MKLTTQTGHAASAGHVANKSNSGAAKKAISQVSGNESADESKDGEVVDTESGKAVEDPSKKSDANIPSKYADNRTTNKALDKAFAKKPANLEDIAKGLNTGTPPTNNAAITDLASRVPMTTADRILATQNKDLSGPVGADSANQSVRDMSFASLQGQFANDNDTTAARFSLDTPSSATGAGGANNAATWQQNGANRLGGSNPVGGGVGNNYNGGVQIGTQIGTQINQVGNNVGAQVADVSFNNSPTFDQPVSPSPESDADLFANVAPDQEDSTVTETRSS